MAQLHKLLAVVAGLKGAATKILRETQQVFVGKGHMFDGRLKTYKPDAEGGDTIPEERDPLVSTVGEKLGHLAEMATPGIDAAFQVEDTNTQARADLELDDGVVIKNVPVTFLLQFDKMVIELRNVYDAIPTRDPKYEWVDAPEQGKGISTNRYQEYSNRLLEEIIPLVLAAATDKHPAQVQLQKKSIKVGVWSTQYWTGKISPAQKYELLKRVDMVHRAVKQAMAKANETEHSTRKVADQVFSFINGDLPLAR